MWNISLKRKTSFVRSFEKSHKLRAWHARFFRGSFSVHTQARSCSIIAIHWLKSDINSLCTFSQKQVVVFYPIHEPSNCWPLPMSATWIRKKRITEKPAMLQQLKNRIKFQLVKKIMWQRVDNSKWLDIELMIIWNYLINKMLTIILWSIGAKKPWKDENVKLPKMKSYESTKKTLIKHIYPWYTHSKVRWSIQSILILSVHIWKLIITE